MSDEVKQGTLKQDKVKILRSKLGNSTKVLSDYLKFDTKLFFVLDLPGKVQPDWSSLRTFYGPDDRQRMVQELIVVDSSSSRNNCLMCHPSLNNS